MANIFKPKRSNTSSSVPTTGDLTDGELAVNSADKIIYLRDGGSIVEVANYSTGTGGGGESYWVQTDVGIHTLSNVGIGSTQPTATLDVNGTLNVTGVSTFQGNVNLGDNDKIIMGDSGDLEIYHNGGNSGSEVSSSQGLFIRANRGFPGADFRIYIQAKEGEASATFIPDGAAELYYDNSKKFETTGAGAYVFGTLGTQQFNVSGVSTFQGNVILGTQQLKFNGSSLNISHNNTDALFLNGKGDIRFGVNNNSSFIIERYLSETIAKFTHNGPVELYYDNSKKFETTGYGVTVSGGVYASGISTFQDDVDITGNLTVDTNTLFVNSANNRIGIGTTNPAYQVEIENTGANALLVLDRTDGAACFIEGQATRSAFGSVNATPLALAYNSAAVVLVGASGSITVNPDGDGFTFPTTDGSANQVLQTDGNGTLSFADSVTATEHKILDDISSSFNGSTTQFTISSSSTNFLNSEITTAARLLISVGGVVQQPDPTQTNGFYISGGTDLSTDPIKINFVEAPKAGQVFFGVAFGLTTSPTSSFVTSEEAIAYSIVFGV